MIRSPIFCLTLLLLLPVALRSVEEPPQVLSFQVFLWPGTPNPNLEKSVTEKQGNILDGKLMPLYVPPTLQYSPDGGEEVRAIDAAVRRLSRTYQYAGYPPLRFFREESISENQVKRVPLGEVNIPSTMQRALLLFLPNTKKPDEYLIYPIENSITRTKPGQACVINISSKPVVCLFNQEKLFLESGDSEIVPIGANAQVSIVVRIGAEADNGKWKERYAQRLNVKPDDSLTVLLYNKQEMPDTFRIMAIDNPKDEAPQSPRSVAN